MQTRNRQLIPNMVGLRIYKELVTLLGALLLSNGELQIFISSQMRKDALKNERAAAVEAVNDYPGLKPWHWDACGFAGQYPPMQLCLDAVINSDMLILLLGYGLTDNTRQEHETAVNLKIPDLVFVKEGRMKKETRQYLANHENRVTYMVFRSTSELKTMITKSLTEEISRGYRRGAPRIGTRVSYSRSSARRSNG